MGTFWLTAVAPLAAILLMPSNSSAEPQPADRNAFIAAYECELTLRLFVIHVLGDPAWEDNRFLTLSLKDEPGHYVQCAYFDNDAQMMCEAASGYFSAAEGKPPLFHLADDRVAALGALGFSTDGSHGNYRETVDMSRTDSYRETGKLLLAALFEGFDARLGAPIELTAPLLQPDKHRTLLKGNCTP